MIILGAGMAGCIAGIVNQDAVIFEAASEPVINHQALLRFKDESVGNAVGIPFRRVMVQKSIWYDSKEVAPSPRFTHLYSMKVVGRYMERSISDINSDIRYVAPHDFHKQMTEKLEDRINYSFMVENLSSDAVEFFDDERRKGVESYTRQTHGEAIISTLPLPVNATLADMELHLPDNPIGMEKIFISQFEMRNCDSFATVYFPGQTSVYRASVTGNLLIIESMAPISPTELDDVYDAFGFGGSGTEKFINRPHANGKIAPMDESIRRNFIHKLTTKCNVYSLGRYATWRNIILDDVLKDIYAIKRMINMDAYSLRRGH